MREIAIGFRPTKEDTLVLMPRREGSVGDGVGLNVGDISITTGATETNALANIGL
jgi:hypothetical protein